MSLGELVKQRFSVRAYLDRPVEEEKIMQVLEAARVAPSAANRQPWHFVVITDPAQRTALGEAYGKEWFVDAPVQLAFCADTQACWKRGDGKSYADVDVAIAFDHMTLAAAEIGLGTCWIGAFKADVARRVLGLPDHVEPIALTPLGYHEQEVPEKKRKSMDEVVHWQRFGGKR
jgi:nitroreductase